MRSVKGTLPGGKQRVCEKENNEFNKAGRLLYLLLWTHTLFFVSFTYFCVFIRCEQNFRCGNERKRDANDKKSITKLSSRRVFRKKVSDSKREMRGTRTKERGSFEDGEIKRRKRKRWSTVSRLRASSRLQAAISSRFLYFELVFDQIFIDDDFLCNQDSGLVGHKQKNKGLDRGKRERCRSIDLIVRKGAESVRSTVGAVGQNKKIVEKIFEGR